METNVDKKNDNILLLTGIMSLILVFHLDNEFIFGKMDLLKVLLSITLSILSITFNVTYLKRKRLKSQDKLKEFIN